MCLTLYENAFYIAYCIVCLFRMPLGLVKTGAQRDAPQILLPGYVVGRERISFTPFLLYQNGLFWLWRVNFLTDCLKNVLPSKEINKLDNDIIGTVSNLRSVCQNKQKLSK